MNDTEDEHPADCVPIRVALDRVMAALAERQARRRAKEAEKAPVEVKP